MPLRVVIPSSEMNPIIAGMLSSPDVQHKIMMPPIIASGILINIMSDSFMSRNSEYSNMRMIINAPIEVRARVRDASASLSNCPP